MTQVEARLSMIVLTMSLIARSSERQQKVDGTKCVPGVRQKNGDKRMSTNDSSQHSPVLRSPPAAIRHAVVVLGQDLACFVPLTIFAFGLTQLLFTLFFLLRAIFGAQPFTGALFGLHPLASQVAHQRGGLQLLHHLHPIAGT